MLIDVITALSPFIVSVRDMNVFAAKPTPEAASAPAGAKAIAELSLQHERVLDRMRGEMLSEGFTGVQGCLTRGSCIRYGLFAGPGLDLEVHAAFMSFPVVLATHSSIAVADGACLWFDVSLHVLSEGKSY